MPTSRHAQRGVTLFVGMIMLVLITLMVTTAFTLSNTNLKAVGNMQAKDEAIAAANMAIEQVLSSPFTDTPVAEEINVDINNDGTTDYVVSIVKPVCIRASIYTTNAAVISSVTLGAAMSPTATFDWSTLWEIEAKVNDARSGAKTTVRTGTQVLLPALTQDEIADQCV